MDVPVLKTKLFVPAPRPELVRRSRLNELLDAGLHRKLTLISAPAGFGKTTLVSDWAVRSQRPTAWLSLEEGDNDPVRFLSYLLAALRSVHPGLAEDVLADYQTLRPSAAETIMTELLNEITDIEEHFILVLDDLHLIRDKAILGYVSFMIEHLPSQMHLVISTRADPPFPLGALRAGGQMTELRSSDLRFNQTETAEFLNRISGLNLSEQNVQALAARTEGWIAGLQMAAVSMRGRQDMKRFIESFTGSNRYVLDYLVEEVLQRQPEEIQRFLLRTSILQRLCGELCEVVSGQTEGQKTLERLERDNLFIVALDSEHRWYRYHRLFADLLRSRLSQLEGNAVAELYQRAGEWYEGNGLVRDAIDQYVSGKDFEKAVRLIEESAEGILMRSEFATFLGWVQALPEEAVCRRPLLCVYHALALLLDGAPLNAIRARVEEALKADSGRQVSGQLAAFRALLAAIQGDAEESLRLGNLAMESLPEDEQLFRGTIHRVLANVTYAASGEVRKAIRIFEDGIQQSLREGNLAIAVICLCELGEVYMTAGQLHRADDTYQRALELAADSQGARLPIVGLAMIGLGNLLRERNDLERGGRLLREGIELVQKFGVIGALDGYIALARLTLAEGRPLEAERLFDAAHKIATRFDASELDDLSVALQRERMWLIRGKTAQAARSHQEWVDRREKRKPHIPYILQELDRMIEARILLARGETARCLSTAEQLEKKAEKLGRRGVALEALIVQSLAHRSRQDTEAALAALEKALQLAEPEGYCRIFLDEGPAMARLLYEAAGRGLGVEYTGRLLAWFPPEPGAGKKAARGEELFEPLSRRELEVLRLLAEGAANKEVARRLFISLPTVKWHTSNIYGKLCVQNRTQAVAKARALGLLGG
jgi:LuxR family maltose regulon positive regulatory protein